MKKAMFVRMSVLIPVCIAAGGVLVLGRWQAEPARIAEPIVVSLGIDPLELTTPESGVRFDLDADGLPERLGWTVAGRQDAFLAIDENHNGRIDNGSEIVGAGVSGPANGFRYLEAIDGFSPKQDFMTAGLRPSRDGRIDANDGIFTRLILWTDLNHNGQSEESELQSAAYAGFSELELQDREPVNMRDGPGNRFRERAVARLATSSSPDAAVAGVAGSKAPDPVRWLHSVRLAKQAGSAR